MTTTRTTVIIIWLCSCLLFTNQFETEFNSSPNPHWTGRGFLSSDTGWYRRIMEPVWSLMGSRANDPWRYVMPVKRLSRTTRAAGGEIPKEFDARIQWPYCPTIREIFEQGKCASCWAVAPTDVMSDRICIRSRGRQIVRLSAGNLLSCCKLCGRGCKGGYPGGAWMYWLRNGIVTGSSYSSDYGCQRYPFIPCYQQRGAPGSAWKKCPEEDNSALKCRQTCQPSYKLSYKQDLYYAQSVYRVPNDVQAIQLEIMENGPVQANVRVYEDFLNYKSGVYRHLKGKGLEYHAVKILGWGVDRDGTPYWTAANPWSKRWGDRGFFKILRGFNHAEIETHIMAGIPLLSPNDVTISAINNNETWMDTDEFNMIDVSAQG